MAANKSQGSYFGLFLAGSTVLCAGIAYLDSGTGKALAALGAIALIGSLFGFLGIKPLEGKTPLKPSPAGMKLVGAAVAVLGWILTLTGIHITASTGGRIIFALLGIGVSLVGIIYILPAAFNKNALWKKDSGVSERAGITAAAKTTMEHSR
jgi:FtsH-binding integral membrane protein